jgi:dihydrofolate reductase
LARHNYAKLQGTKFDFMKAIVAMTRSRVIGKENKIPWRLPGEQKWFKEVTMGHPVLMGRKTFESIGRPLPGRRNLVVTRAGEIPGVELIRDLQKFDPIPYERDGPEIFVVGGAEIYKTLLPHCNALYATIVQGEYVGDAYFPEFESEFELSETIREAPEFNVYFYKRREVGK